MNRWRIKGKGLMRAFVVVEGTPVIEAQLTVVKRVNPGTGVKTGGVEQLVFQGSVEPFIFTLGLRMIGSAMTDGDAKTQQPDGQARIGIFGGASPRAASVHQHSGRQAELSKQGGDMALDSIDSLIRAGFQPNQKPRVVIQHGQPRYRSQRMTALAGADGEIAFEIHLPQVIGFIHLKVLIGRVLPGLVSRQQPMACQDIRHGAGGWNRLITPVFEPAFQFSTAPGGMQLSGFDNDLLNFWRGVCGTALLPALTVRPVGSEPTLTPLNSINGVPA